MSYPNILGDYSLPAQCKYFSGLTPESMSVDSFRKDQHKRTLLMAKNRWYEIPVGIGSAMALGWILVGNSAAQAPLSANNFRGGEPVRETADDAATSRLRFPAGVRSNWHHHSGGQLLMLQEGRVVTQVRGGPLKEVHPGEPWWTDAGVEHWHGAHPEQDAYQLTITVGTTPWLEPVSDEEYLATPTREQ
jgi:quercetin dioxygenase-like cupin family protein